MTEQHRSNVDRSNVNDLAAENPESAAPAPGDPQLDDPERDEIPPAPPRPRDFGRQKPPEDKPRRFAGTAQQISSALNFYKIFAFITGIMLLLLVVKMIADYGFNVELYLGGTTIDGGPNTIGIHTQESVVEGRAVSTWIAQVHGVVYIIYVIAGYRLWALMQWKVKRLINIVLGGVVPFLSFIVERRIAKEVQADMDANPQAVRRY